MAEDQDKTAPTRSEQLLLKRKLCFEHAADLIEAAERTLNAGSPLPNIAYHLSLLALEEIGKARLITSREVSARRGEERWFEKRLDDHISKILWALWPTSLSGDKLDQQAFEDIKEFSQRAHSRRLAGLYVDTNVDGETMAAPGAAVTQEEAHSILGLAKENLDFHSSESSPNIDVDDELLIWFLETVSDELGQRRLFSSPFLRKYEELHGDARAWAAWAKVEFAKLKEEEAAQLKAELSRVPDSTRDSTPKWRINIRVYCASHSIRAKALNYWNANIKLAKLKFVKNNELLLEVTLGDHVNVYDVYNAGLSLSKLIIACLNIGSAGFFWYEIPSQDTRYFKKIEDLTRPDMKMEMGKGRGLERHWLKVGATPKRIVLEEKHLEHAVKCAAAFGSMDDAEAEPIFRPYLHGLILLSKSDIHLSLDQLAFGAFDAALKAALRHFNDWDGETESLVPCLHQIFSEIIPESEHRDLVFEHLIVQPSPTEISEEHAVSAKRLVDLYLALVADRQMRGS